ncbi:MAG: MATE family efflux transporter [Oscillospiraceae bacterium]|nr:MATE family efflux transporter [Oscillospiraceae bacterium]
MGKQIDLTQGPIWKRLLQFFLPILLGVFFQQLYNTVDALVVGNFVGKKALAAVGGSASQVINLLVGFFNGLASGATVIIAQLYGGKQHSELKSALHTSLLFSILGGALLTVVGLFVAEPGLRLMNTPEDTMEYSMQYTTVIFIGVIPSLLYNIGSGILRALGDSRRPLIYLVICCITNTVLDLLFVVIFRMEVLGVAIATVLAQCVSAVLVLCALGKLNEAYRFRVRDLRISGSDLGGILRIGLPAAIQSSTYSISNLLLMASINVLGTDTVAGNTAAGKVDSIFWMLMGALGTTVLTFVGQNIGAKQLKRAKQGIKTCLFAGIAITVVITLILMSFGEFLLGLFNQDSEVIRIGYRIMWFCVPCYVFWVLIEVFSGALRGSGDALIPMVLNLVGICALRLVWLYTVVPAHHTIDTIMLSYPVTWVITGTAFMIYYFRGGWTKRTLTKAAEEET